MMETCAPAQTQIRSALYQYLEEVNPAVDLFRSAVEREIESIIQHGPSPQEEPITAPEIAPIAIENAKTTIMRALTHSRTDGGASIRFVGVEERQPLLVRNSVYTYAPVMVTVRDSIDYPVREAMTGFGTYMDGDSWFINQVADRIPLAAIADRVGEIVLVHPQNPEVGNGVRIASRIQLLLHEEMAEESIERDVLYIELNYLTRPTESVKVAELEQQSSFCEESRYPHEYEKPSLLNRCLEVVAKTAVVLIPLTVIGTMVFSALSISRSLRTVNHNLNSIAMRH
jgi:hypothetical protein